MELSPEQECFVPVRASAAHQIYRRRKGSGLFGFKDVSLAHQAEGRGLDTVLHREAFYKGEGGSVIELHALPVSYSEDVICRCEGEYDGVGSEGRNRMGQRGFTEGGAAPSASPRWLSSQATV